MRFLAILLLAPWLTVLGWLYWRYVRGTYGARTGAGADVLVLICSMIAAVACTEIAYAMETGIAGAIWKQVAAALACYAGFSAALLAGLLRHAWLRRRRTTDATART